jgi:hypothetical protein
MTRLIATHHCHVREKIKFHLALPPARRASKKYGLNY